MTVDYITASAAAADGVSNVNRIIKILNRRLNPALISSLDDLISVATLSSVLTNEEKKLSRNCC